MINIFFNFAFMNTMMPKIANNEKNLNNSLELH